MVNRGDSSVPVGANKRSGQVGRWLKEYWRLAGKYIALGIVFLGLEALQFAGIASAFSLIASRVVLGFLLIAMATDRELRNSKLRLHYHFRWWHVATIAFA